MDKKSRIFNYAFQSTLATIAMIGIMMVLNPFTQGIFVGAIGSTAFVVFALPKHTTAKPRNVIGGQFIGVISGIFCHSLLFLVPGFFDGGATTIGVIVTASMSVGISIFLMTATDAEHPPASGTAMGLAITGWSIPIVLFMLAAACLLSIAKRMLGPFLMDLL